MKTIKNKFFIIILLFSSFTFIVTNFIKYKLSDNLEREEFRLKVKNSFKKYLLPYRTIDYLRSEYSKAHKYEKRYENYSYTFPEVYKLIVNNDLNIQKKLANLEYSFVGKNIVDKNTGMKIEKFQASKNILLSGSNKYFPATVFISNDDRYIYMLSSTGTIAYAKPSSKEIVFKQIKNNINEYININQFLKKNTFGTKDLLISDDKVFVSYTREVSEDCWNISLLKADLNLKELKFNPLFSSEECVHKYKNPDNEFAAMQSGGKITRIDQDNLVLTTGEFRSRYRAQDKKSIMGKTLKINLNSGKYSILSLGHRNPQGIFFDNVNNFLITTEHGPKGGDEINIIELDNKNEGLQNFGWPISSYGNHYTKKVDLNKYPLKKSHKKYGFIEPIRYFVPSIGINEIIAINKKEKKYLFSSLRGRSLYFMQLNQDNKIIDIRKYLLNERIRDMIIFKDFVITYLEESGSYGILKLSKF